MNESPRVDALIQKVLGIPRFISAKLCSSAGDRPLIDGFKDAERKRDDEFAALNEKIAELENLKEEKLPKYCGAWAVGRTYAKKILGHKKTVRCGSQDRALQHIRAVAPITMTLTVSLRAFVQS